ncbi:hypothetical protein C1S82_02010 [Mycolicibacterium cosmeticum]|uniref:Uncharacterized protein n=1 Tax=Mycolicibacterium cosmeticum TaxID=258533 RepID=W9AXV2_MYCCO|nr:hypothetical protein [Mycolicibacterium cosmeticum]TLH81508.1 hypothetical protein C1S82_02010 [Mycolicibacterium cosmeticum]CDO10368.1 hypothetical protein BN977_05200 [Mycolicibacterium cosmeticum]
MNQLGRLAQCVAIVMVVAVGGCAPSGGPEPATPIVPFLDSLPRLTDVPELTSLTYRVPAERGFFKDDDRWADCGHYPEVGDLSAVGVQGEYEAAVPGHADWPTFFVRLRPARDDENVAAELSDWTQRCPGGELETLNPRMPLGASLLTLTGPGVRRAGPPAVKIVAASSNGVTFEAWAQSDWRDGFRFEVQLGLLARSFLRGATPSAVAPVAQRTPAELSKLFVFPGQAWGRVDIAYDTKPGEPRLIGPPDDVCHDDPLRASSYAGVSSSDQPADLDALVKYSGTHSDNDSDTPVTVVYREHPGVDSLARMRDWISQCESRPSDVPPICADGGVKPQFVRVAQTVEDEQVIGYRRFDLVEFGGGHAGHPSCGATARLARTVRVAGLLVHTEMAVDATGGPPDWSAAVKPLNVQVGQVVAAIQHAN